MGLRCRSLSLRRSWTRNSPAKPAVTGDIAQLSRSRRMVSASESTLTGSMAPDRDASACIGGFASLNLPRARNRPIPMMIFRVAESRHDYACCIVVRTLVFEVEQNVDIDLEVDEYEEVCRHILGVDGRTPVAAARWRIYKPGVAKIERVAVLKAWRGRNLGTALMETVISDIRNAGPELKTLRLQAQDPAIPFYEKMGFAVVGGGFLEAGIPHHAMERCA